MMGYKAKKKIVWYNDVYNEGDVITDEGLIQYGLQEGIVVKASGQGKPDKQQPSYDLDGDGDFDKDDVSIAAKAMNKGKSLKKSTKKKKSSNKKKAKK